MSQHFAGIAQNFPQSACIGTVMATRIESWRLRFGKVWGSLPQRCHPGPGSILSSRLVRSVVSGSGIRYCQLTNEDEQTAVVVVVRM